MAANGISTLPFNSLTAIGGGLGGGSAGVRAGTSAAGTDGLGGGSGGNRASGGTGKGGDGVVMIRYRVA